MSRFLRWRNLIVVIIALVLPVGCWLTWCVHVSLDAEKTHQSYIRVLEALTGFVEENNGRWPRGWDELARFALGRDPSKYARFNDLRELRRRVEIRFDVTANEVAQMDTEGFSAVKPIGANYGDDAARIEGLKRAAVRTRKEGTRKRG